MDIKNSFEVPLSVSDAWKVLLDIERIAPCLPGAELLEIVDSKTYKGKVSVKLGPVALVFVGTAVLEEIDDKAYRARVKAQGSDSKGRGGANAAVSFALSPVSGGTRVDVATDLNLSGWVAQYGRGVGLIQEVATHLLGQFAESLRRMLEHDRAAAAAVAGPQLGERQVVTGQVLVPTKQKPIPGFSLALRVLWNHLRRLLGLGSA